jgi:CBS domain-containing protein
VKDATIKPSAGGFQSLPVVDGDDKLKGVVTSTDIIQYVLVQY